jgi:hypothetical protein
VHRGDLSTGLPTHLHKMQRLTTRTATPAAGGGGGAAPPPGAGVAVRVVNLCILWRWVGSPVERSPRCTLERRLGGSQNRSERFTENYLSSSEIELRFSGRLAGSLATYTLSLIESSSACNTKYKNNKRFFFSRICVHFNHVSAFCITFLYVKGFSVTSGNLVHWWGVGGGRKDGGVCSRAFSF